MSDDVLISFCNLAQGRSPFSLGRVNLGTGAVQIVDLGKLSRATSFSGMTGLCRVGDHVFVGLQARHSGLAVLDRHLALVEVRRLAKVRDIHSMCPHGKDLLIASTGTDEVIRYETRSGRESVAFSAAKGRSDTLHLNSICVHQGHVLAGMFGEQRSGGVRLGRVQNLEDGAILLDGLRQPHSLLSTGRFCFVLESNTGFLIKFNGQSHIEDWGRYTGYVRGICQCRQDLVVGKSAMRGWSRSRDRWRLTTMALVSPQGFNEPAHSALFIRGFDGTDRAIDLIGFGAEIYDMIPFIDQPASASIPEAWVRASYCLHGARPNLAEAQLIASASLDATYMRLLAETQLAADDPSAAEHILSETPSDGAGALETKRLLGKALQRQGRYAEAADIARQVCAEHPFLASFWVQLSEFLTQANQLDEAEAAICRAIKLIPRNAECWNRLSRLRLSLGRPLGAMEAVTEGLALSPLDPSLLAQRGRVLWLLDRAGEARECLLLAAEIGPGSAATHFDTGVVLELLQDPVAALAQYTLASRLEPENQEIAKRVQIVRNLVDAMALAETMPQTRTGVSAK